MDPKLREEAGKKRFENIHIRKKKNAFKSFRFQLALGAVCCQVNGFGLHMINLFNRCFDFTV